MSRFAVASIRPVRSKMPALALPVPTSMPMKCPAISGRSSVRRPGPGAVGVAQIDPVLELLAAWSDGAREEPAVLYVGDDVTDEDAFRELGSAALAVTVQVGGGGETAARYRIAEQGEVARLLGWLAELRGAGAAP